MKEEERIRKGGRCRLKVEEQVKRGRGAGLKMKSR